MKHDQNGSHIILLGVLIVVIGVVGLVGWRVVGQKKSSQSEVNDAKAGKLSADVPRLKSLGFKLDYYDATTQRAGDYHFTKELAKIVTDEQIYQKRIWDDFGTQDVRSPNDPTKRNVQPTFRLPLGTKVLAPIDGEVTKVEKLYSNDWTIWYASSQKSDWSYETEHVINPVVKVGDKVQAGQVVAEVSDYEVRNTPGFGLVELGLFHPIDNQPAHWCPFTYLDDSVKDDLNKKIKSFYNAWESFMKDTSIYKQESFPTPGCASLEPAKG